MIYILIDKIDLNYLSKNDETILQLLLNYNDIKLINIILDKNINLNNQEKEYGLAAIHQSIINNLSEITIKLIKKGADINIQDFYGNTPLMYAVNEKFIKQINIIINNNINYNLTNIHGETTLHLLLKNFVNYINYNKIIVLFIQNTNLDIQDNDGNTCLFLIIQN